MTSAASPDAIAALETSVHRLHSLVTGLDERDLVTPSYADEWTIAQVLSHLGSGAVIMGRRLQEALDGGEPDDGFAPSVWDEWNAKPPEAQAADALVTDAALLERIASLGPDDRARVELKMGTMRIGFARFVGMRLNEHVLHTWDVEVALDPAATLPEPETALVVDSLDVVVGWAGRPPGDTRTVTIRTHGPERHFMLRLAPDSVALSTAGDDRGEGPAPDLEAPAEAFVRLVYGRLDPDHTPSLGITTVDLDLLRRTFPGF